MVGLSTHPADHELSEEQSHAVAGLVREELARRRISRQFLADQARISLSTLEKALSGRRPFTLATLIRLEEALGVKLRHPEAESRPPRRGHSAGRAGRRGAGGARLLFPAGRVLDRGRVPDAAAVLRRPPRHLRLPHRDPLGRRRVAPGLPRGRAGRRRLHPARHRLGAAPIRTYLPGDQHPRAVPDGGAGPADHHRRDARHPDHAAGRARIAARRRSRRRSCWCRWRRRARRSSAASPPTMPATPATATSCGGRWKESFARFLPVSAE